MWKKKLGMCGIANATYMNLGKLQEMVRKRKAWHTPIHGAAKSDWASEQHQHTLAKSIAWQLPSWGCLPSLILKVFLLQLPNREPALLDHTCDWWVTYLLQASNSRKHICLLIWSTSRVTSWFPKYLKNIINGSNLSREKEDPPPTRIATLT